MTIEKLVGETAYYLTNITDEQYLKWFEEQGYLNVTRPERTVKQQKTQEQQIMQMNPKLKAGMELAKSLGISVDMAALTYKGRKK